MIVTATALDPTTGLLQYGVLGIFAVILLVLSKTLIRREQERADRLDAEVNRLNSLIQDKTIPALISATSAIQASQLYLQSLQYQRDVLKESAAQMADRAREGGEP